MRLGLIVVLAACRPDLAFVPETLPEATVGRRYHASIEVTGAQTPVGNISAEPLPPGLALTYDEQKRSGIASIDGTPTVAGRVSVTVRAWCFGTNRTGQRGSHVYDLIIH